MWNLGRRPATWKRRRCCGDGRQILKLNFEFDWIEPLRRCQKRKSNERKWTSWSAWRGDGFLPTLGFGGGQLAALCFLFLLGWWLPLLLVLLACRLWYFAPEQRHWSIRREQWALMLRPSCCCCSFINLAAPDKRRGEEIKKMSLRRWCGRRTAIISSGGK